MCLTIFSPDIWPGEGFSYSGLRICSGAPRIFTERCPSLYRDDALSTPVPVLWAETEITGFPVTLEIRENLENEFPFFKSANLREFEKKNRKSPVCAEYYFYYFGL